MSKKKEVNNNQITEDVVNEDMQENQENNAENASTEVEEVVVKENKEKKEAKAKNDKNDNKKKAKNGKQDNGKSFGKKVSATVSELKKVTWPSFGQTVKQTGVVLAFVLMFIVLLLGVNALLGWIFELLVG